MPIGRLTTMAALASALVVALAGCGSSGDAKAAPPLTPPPGYEVVADAAAGFAIALPEQWVQLPLFNLKLFEDSAARLSAEDPQLGDVLFTAKTLVGRARLFALSPADKGAASVNLIAAEAGGDKSLDVAAKNATDELARLGATGITQEGASLAGGPAIKAMFSLDVRTEKGIRTVATTQYYMLRNEMSYVLTFTGAGPEIETIAQSLRIR